MQALSYMVILQASVLLAVSIAVVAYVDSLLQLYVVTNDDALLQQLLRLGIWLRPADFRKVSADYCYVARDLLLPGHGLSCREVPPVLPQYKQWLVSIDVQQQDVLYVLRNLAVLCMYVVMVQQASGYWPYWLCRPLFLGYCLQWMPPVARLRQKVRLIAALCFTAKLACAWTDIPLPASTSKIFLVLGLLSCLAPRPTIDNLDHLLAASSTVANSVLACSLVAPILLWYRLLKPSFEAVFAAVSCAFSFVANRSSSILVMVGAAEVIAVSAVAKWWRGQRAKFAVKYKHMRRIWRHTGGNVGPFLWHLLHGIDSSHTSGAARGRRSGSKGGSKRGSKPGAERSGHRSSRSSSSSAAGLHETPSVDSSVLRDAPAGRRQHLLSIVAGVLHKHLVQAQLEVLASSTSRGRWAALLQQRMTTDLKMLMNPSDLSRLKVGGTQMQCYAILVALQSLLSSLSSHLASSSSYLIVALNTPLSGRTATPLLRAHVAA
jgi:hypothetical protein